MSLYIELQNVIESDSVPELESFNKWVDTALSIVDSTFKNPELTIRIVSPDESQQLNTDYRQKNKPTNVLSFPFVYPEMLPDEEVLEYLGDLVICESVLIKESEEQQKKVRNHWAHLVIHGVFHLLGYDHIETDQAEAMEQLEIDALALLGIDNPYQI